jgi:putative RNA 2'-phosphotransferase
MDDKAPLVQLSKLMSLALRHEPGRFGLTLDPEGYVSIEELITALEGTFPGISASMVMDVVHRIEQEKKRFSVRDDDIRANYGHSLAEAIKHEAVTPPGRLLHGTHRAAVESILANGLMPMNRQYVHLTNDIEIARRVGARRGAAIILSIDAASAHANAIPFFRANEFFWLANSVPARFLSVLD